MPVYTKLNAIYAKSERALEETRVLNERLSVIERKSNSEVDRVARLESKMSNLQLHGFQSNSNGSDKNNQNNYTISFKGFNTDSLNTRFEIVKQFVDKFHGNDTFVYLFASTHV